MAPKRCSVFHPNLSSVESRGLVPIDKTENVLILMRSLEQLGSQIRLCIKLLPNITVEDHHRMTLKIAFGISFCGENSESDALASDELSEPRKGDYPIVFAQMKRS